MGKKLKVLIVNDIESSRLIARSLALNFNCTAKTVKDGQEAIKAALDETFDIILMDLIMPKIDGLLATKIIRLGVSYQPYIVAITSDDRPGTATKCIEAGMNDFMYKPFSVRKMDALITRYYTSI